MITSRIVLCALAFSSLWAVASNAQSIGAAEFMNSCASCHGTNGRGDGPVSKHLLNLPPDLTMLSKNNDGVFPANRLFDVIEGSADVAVHGGRDMPVWGPQYTGRSLSHQGTPSSAGEAESYARALTLSLIDHLSTMQVQ